MNPLTLSLTPRRQTGRRHSFSSTTRPGVSHDPALDPHPPTIPPSSISLLPVNIQEIDAFAHIIPSLKHSPIETGPRAATQLLQSEIRSLVVENQRLARNVEDADREARHTSIRTRATEDQLRTEITQLHAKLNESSDGSKTITFESLAHLLIRGSIESVTTSPTAAGTQKLVIIGRITEVDDEPFNLEDEFAQISAENDDLRDQIGDLQAQLGRLMKAQVHSLTGELELVQAESQSLRNQTFALDALTEENAFLRHRILALETQKLDYQHLVDPSTEGLCKRGTHLVSILEGLDDSDDPIGFAEDVAERLTEVERRCVQLEGRNEQTVFQTESEQLRSETDVRVTILEASEGEADVSRGVKDEGLEEQLNDLQATCEAISNERDELQIRVREQTKVIHAFERLLDNGEMGDQAVVAVVGDCLKIVKTSQLESTRAYEELRLLHRQIHAIEEENTRLKQEVSNLRREMRFEN